MVVYYFQVGLQTVGVVHHIMQYGIFVELAPGIVGLAPNSVRDVLYLSI